MYNHSLKRILTTCLVGILLLVTGPAVPCVQAEAKQRGGEVVVGLTQEPDFLDPYLSVAAGTKEILYNIFEGLVKMTPEGDFVPCLAESWEIEEAGKRYRFVLRQGVTFHNGQAMTAEDVQYSLERAAGLGSNEEILVPELAGIQAVTIDEKTGDILIEQKQVDPDLIAYLTTAIMPRDYTEQNEHPCGTGPFRFVSYTPQLSMEMEANPDYWQPDLPYLDHVIFQIYSDMDAAYLDLLAGEIQIFPYLTVDKAKGLSDHYDVVAGGINMIQLLAMNNQSEPLDDPAVREAIDLALDREQIIEHTMGEYGQPLWSGLAPSMQVYFQDKIAGATQADPEKAMEKLKAAGYPDGMDVTITVPGNYLIHVDTANLIAAQLAQANIRASIEPVEWGTWLERVYLGRDYQMTVIALTYDYFTPSCVLDRYSTEAEDNFINFHSDTYDRLVEKAGQELDPEKRIADYKELQDILFEDHASAFLQEPYSITVVHKDLDGYVLYPAYIQDLSGVYYK